MNGLDYRNGSIVYTDDAGEHLLIDSTDYLSNISRIPLHGDDDLLTIGKYVISLMQKHSEFAAGTDQEGRAPYYTVIDSLISNCLMRICGPKMKKPAIGIIGGENSPACAHVKSLATLFDPEIVVCTIENPEIEDYEAYENYFDIVLVDGSVRFEDPKFIIEYGQTILGEKGSIIVYNDRQPLLESTFSLINPERDEYRFNPETVILLAQKCKK